MDDVSPGRRPTPLFERPGLPLPAGPVVPGATPAVAVGVAPPQPGNAVLLFVRRDRGPAQVLRAVPELAAGAAEQWFRAPLPAVEAGRRLDYRLELVRAGLRLATLPSDGTWLTLTGGPTPDARSPAAADGPLFDYELSFLGSITDEFRPEVIGLTSEGFRINFFLERGRLVGPAIDATARDGGDWLLLRPDGVGVLDVRMTYETADGALLYYRAGGVADLAPAVYAAIVAGELAGEVPIYATPTFLTADPRWLWLNRVQAFGIGWAELAPPSVKCDIYLPRMLGPKGHA